METAIPDIAESIVIEQLAMLAIKILPKKAAFAVVKAMAHSFHAHGKILI
jgi:hypothetical protein